MYRLVILNYNDKIYFWHLYIKRVRLILISSFVFNLHVAMTLIYTTQWLNQWIYAYHPPCSSYGLQV